MSCGGVQGGGGVGDEGNEVKVAVSLYELYIWADPGSKTSITCCENETRTLDAFSQASVIFQCGGVISTSNTLLVY